MTWGSGTLESAKLESVALGSVTLESVRSSELRALSESWVVRPAVTGALVRPRMARSLVRPGRLYRAGAWVRLGAGYHDEAWLWELSELMELMELCALRMLRGRASRSAGTGVGMAPSGSCIGAWYVQRLSSGNGRAAWMRHGFVAA